MRSDRDRLSPEARWGVGCLVAGAAMTGLSILLMYVAFTLDLPIWAQILLGIGLTFGGGLLTWLIVTALGGTRPSGDDTSDVVERLPRRRERD